MRHSGVHLNPLPAIDGLLPQPQAINSTHVPLLSEPSPPRLHNVQCLGSGWRFPWGLRVRLCEMLLRGVFDTLEEGAYIDEADEYLQLLQVM